MKSLANFTRGLRAKIINHERLEDRYVLSAALPTIDSIAVASEDWSTAFYDYLDTNGLGANGYEIPDGSASQEATLSWNNINQIHITFSEDVHVQAEDLSISGTNTTNYSILDFSYFPETATATWTLDSPLVADRLMLDLDADGTDPITDLDGNILDGEWVNSVSAYGASGNGVAGGDFEFLFNVLPGDTLNSNILDYNNMVTIYMLVGEDTQDASYQASSDVDGDGLVENSDWQEVFANLWNTLPAGDPEGVTNDAPTSIGFDPAEIDDDTIDHIFSLHSVFEDNEDSDSQLVYQIVNNEDPSLFDLVSIDSLSDNLVLNTTSNASGRSEITVRATDQGGLSVESTLIVDVDRQNDVPSIINVTTTDVGLDSWIIEGWVTDSDNDLESMIINLVGGNLFQRTSVSSLGYFTALVQLDPGEEESIDIFIADDGSGDQSNQVNVEIG